MQYKLPILYFKRTLECFQLVSGHLGEKEISLKRETEFTSHPHKKGSCLLTAINYAIIL